MKLIKTEIADLQSFCVAQDAFTISFCADQDMRQMTALIRTFGKCRVNINNKARLACSDMLNSRVFTFLLGLLAHT